MGLAERLKTTFLDADGSFAIPEILAAVAGSEGVVTSLWGFWGRNQPFDLQAFGLGLGAIIVALGAAQRIRDGKNAN